MVRVFLSNLNCRDADVYTSYELPPGKSVWDLKAAIEESEGIPAGSQKLEFDDEVLQNNHSLDSYSFPEGSLIKLLRTPILLDIIQTDYVPDRWRTMPFTKSESEFIPITVTTTIIKEIDLNKKVKEFRYEFLQLLKEPLITNNFLSELERTRSKGMMLRRGLDLELSLKFGEHLEVLTVDDADKTFYECGLCENDSIQVIVDLRLGSEEYGPERLHYLGEWLPTGYDSCAIWNIKCGALPAELQLEVYHSWNGDMKHKKVKGLALRKGISVAIGGFNEDPEGWLCKYTTEGKLYFPSSYVRIKSTDEDATTTDGIPPLPPFPYPKPSPMEFHVKIADGGHTLLNVSLEYNEICSPDDVTLVRVKLLCKTAGSRRISAISVHIRVPEEELISVHPKEVIESDVAVTEYAVKEKGTSRYGLENIGVHLPVGVDVDIGVVGSRGNEREVSQKGTRNSTKTIMGNIIKGDTVYWSVKEAVTAWGGKGIEGEQGEMWFVLKGKPNRFEYDCLIIHVKDGKEQTKQAISKSWFQRRFM